MAKRDLYRLDITIKGRKELPSHAGTIVIRDGELGKLSVMGLEELDPVQVGRAVQQALEHWLQDNQA